MHLTLEMVAGAALGRCRLVLATVTAITRPCKVFVTLAAILALTACGSKVDKANAYEAQYDRLMGLQAYPAALTSIQQAVDYDQESAQRYIKLGEVQLALDQPGPAAASFQSALDLAPDNITALQNLSILSVRGRQYDMAKRYVEPLLALSADDPAGLLASGAIALDERHYRDVITLSDRIIAALPDRADGYVLKARALDALGNGGEAATILERRVTTAADDKDLLLQLMILYRKRGDTKGVRATAIRLMPLFPDDPRYAIEAARAYAAAGEDGRVRQVIDGLLRRFGAYPDVLIAIAGFWRDTNPPAVARAEIVKLAARSPRPVRSALADRLIDLGAAQDAIGLLAPMAPSAVTSANLQSQGRYARALFAAGQFARAQAKVDAALAFDPDDPGALVVRARLKLRAHDYRGAFTDAQRVVNEDETNEQAALLVPEIYAAQGNPLLAAGAYGNARQRFPGSIAALQAEVGWLLAQQRGEEAAQRVVAFAHARPQDSAAARYRQDICSRVRAAVCRERIPATLDLLS